MGRRGGIWALFVVGYLELGVCTEPPQGARAAPHPSRGRDGLLQEQRHPDVLPETRLSERTTAWIGPAWIGPFELLSEEDVFGAKRRGSSAPPVPEVADKNGHPAATNTTETAPKIEDGPAGPRRRLQKWNKDVSTAVIDRVSRRLGDARDGGARAARMLAARSVVLGREGGVWLRRRWRRKAAYCVVGVYGLRLTWRVISRIKANVLSSGDILLDAEDRILARRGAVLDTEGQAILIRLRALGSPASLAADSPAAAAVTAAAAAAVDATAAAASEQGIPESETHETKSEDGNGASPGRAIDAPGVVGGRGDAGGDGDGGWEAVESSLGDAISLRCVARGGADAGGRARYTEELSDALRKLEQARDEADMESFGPQHTSLVEQGVLLTQARLCDACLRSLRDGLIRASSDLSDLASFWKDQRSTHRRMGVVKSVVLGRLVHGQVSAKRLAVEKDQESISTAELLLEGYLERLGGVQAHLQARPKSCLVNPGFSATTAAGGATFTAGTVEALEGWVDLGMHIFIGSLEHVEAAFDQQQTIEDDDSAGIQPQDVPSGGACSEPQRPRTERDGAAASDEAAAAAEAARDAATVPAGIKSSAADAVESFVSSVASVVANADRLPSSVLQLRAGGGVAGGDGGGNARGCSGRGPLPSGTVRTTGAAAAAAAAAAGAAYGKGRSGRLPAVVLLRPRSKKSKSASGGKERRGGKGARKGTPRKPVASSAGQAPGPSKAGSRGEGAAGGGGEGGGGGVRWGKRVASKVPRDGNKEAAAKGSKKGASVGGKRKKSGGGDGSRGLRGWLAGEERPPTQEKKVRGDGGGAARRSAASAAAGRKDGKGAAGVAAEDTARKADPKGKDPKNMPRVKAGSVSSKDGKRSGTDNREVAAAAAGGGGGALGKLIARFGGDGRGSSPKEEKEGSSRSGGGRKSADSKKMEKDKGSSSVSSAATKGEGRTSTGVGAAATPSSTSGRAGTRAGSSSRQNKEAGGKRVEGTTAVDGFGSRGGAGGRQENRLHELGKDAKEGVEGGKSPPLLPPAAEAALRRPVDGGSEKTSAPSVPRTKRRAADAFLSGPSATAAAAAATAAAGGDDTLLTGNASLSSSTIALTPDVRARALQREEDYARGRRMDLTARKRDEGASVPAAQAARSEGDSGVSVPAVEPSFPIDAVVSSGESTPAGVGVFAACVRRCAAACGSVAGSVSRGTVAVVTSPARLVRSVASGVAPSGTDLAADGEPAAADGRSAVEGGKSAGSGDGAAAAGDGTGASAGASEALPRDGDCDAAVVSADVEDGGGFDGDRDAVSRTGVLAFCVDCCTAACGSILGLVSSGTVEVVNSETVLVGAGAGSLVLSEADDTDEGDQEQLSVRAAAERVPLGTKAGDGVEADALATLSSGNSSETGGCVVGGIAPGNEHLAGTVHTVAGTTAVDSNGLEDDEAEQTVAAAEGERGAASAAAGRMAVGGLVTRPLQAVVVRPCAHLCRLAAAVTPSLSAPGDAARGLARNCGRAGRSAGRATGDASRAIGAGCGRAGRSTARAATAAWLSTAATACMLGDAAARGAVRSTKACLGCVELAGRVLVVLPASTAAHIVGSALRPFSGAPKAAKNETVGEGGGAAEPIPEAGRGADKAAETRSSSSASTAASNSQAGGGVRRWAAQALAYPGTLLGWRRFSGGSPSVTTDLPSRLPPGDGDVASVVLTSPPPASAQEAQAALFRWTTSPPSAGVPEKSGRRSRMLVGGAVRAGRIVVPSGAYTSASSKSSKSTAAAAVVSAPGATRAPRITRALRVLAAQQAAEAGAARPAHWRRVRRIVRLAIAVPVAVRSARYAQNNRAELGHVATEAATGVTSFFSDQLWKPCEAIGKQVFFQERANLMDKSSLEDAETSLQNMLRDFVSDKQNEVPEELREEAAETMDMSVVSRKLEKETKSSVRGTVNGRIPRMLLIQATFLKKELLHLMEAIDELFRANQVTLKLISVVPAALLIFAAVKVSTPFVHAVSSRRWEPTALVHRSMRGSLREMERLLTSSRGFVGRRGLGDEPMGVASLGLLEDQEMGKMALRLHELQTTLRLNGSRFDSRTRRKLEEDLADLMARGRPTVSQQVAVVRRMQRSYAFFRSEGGGGRRK